jgi:hypothetical protein
MFDDGIEKPKCSNKTESPEPPPIATRLGVKEIIEQLIEKKQKSATKRRVTLPWEGVAILDGLQVFMQ